MKQKKTIFNKSIWPKFIVQENNPALFKVLTLSIFTYVIILLTICRITTFPITIIKTQPITLIYEQTYIETSNAPNTSIVPDSKYYGANNQIAAQEIISSTLKNDDPQIKGKILSQKINSSSGERIIITENKDSIPELTIIENSEQSLNNFLKKADTTGSGETIVQSDTTNDDSQYIWLNRNKHREQIKQYVKQQAANNKHKTVQIQNIRSIAAPLRKSESTVTNLGKISMNIHASEFGEYEQRLLEAISYRWQLLSQRLGQSLSAGEIIIKYTLNKDGTITDLKVEKYTTSYSVALICSDAVASQSPQPKWSNGMITKFGDKKQMAVKFIYY